MRKAPIVLIILTTLILTGSVATASQRGRRNTRNALAIGTVVAAIGGHERTAVALGAATVYANHRINRHNDREYRHSYKGKRYSYRNDCYEPRRYRQDYDDDYSYRDYYPRREYRSSYREYRNDYQEYRPVHRRYDYEDYRYQDCCR